MNSGTGMQSELTIAWHNAGATCLLPATKQLFVEKRVQSIIVYPQMSVMENSVAFCEKAMQFLDNDQFEESLIYAEKALHLDATNILAREIMNSAQLKISAGSHENE